LDYDGEIVEYKWEIRDQGVVTTYYTKDVSHVFSIGGQHTIKYTIVDDKGDSTVTAAYVYADGPIMNETPVADFAAVISGKSNEICLDNRATDDGEIVWNAWYIYKYPTAISSTEWEPCLTVDIPPGQSYFDLPIQLSVRDNNYAWAFIKKTYRIQAPAPNTPPVANFTYQADTTEISFTDTSTDDLGVVSWSWNFGDGTTSIEENPVHVYPNVNATYDVTLTVTDGEDATDDVTKSVLVDTIPPSSINLSYSAKKIRGADFTLTLNWDGAPFDNVKIKKNGVVIATTLNDGTYQLDIHKKEKGTTFQVCEEARPYCSNVVVAQF
jgi:PKD repeat protein